MRNRGLLARHKLEDFKKWLTEHGVPYRPGKGAWQVIQVKVPNGWIPVYDRINGDHYTVYSTLVKLVRDFIRYGEEEVDK